MQINGVITAVTTKCGVSESCICVATCDVVITVATEDSRAIDCQGDSDVNVILSFTTVNSAVGDCTIEVDGIISIAIFGVVGINENVGRCGDVDQVITTVAVNGGFVGRCGEVDGIGAFTGVDR